MPGAQNVKVHATEVDCFHQVVTAQDGTRLIHLSTFGSDQRASDPKSSQSMQLDVHAAQELIRILKAEFPENTTERLILNADK